MEIKAEKQHYTGEFCPRCILKGFPCPVLHKEYKIVYIGESFSDDGHFECSECNFTAPLVFYSLDLK